MKKKIFFLLLPFTSLLLSNCSNNSETLDSPNENKFSFNFVEIISDFSNYLVNIEGDNGSLQIVTSKSSTGTYKVSYFAFNDGTNEANLTFTSKNKIKYFGKSGSISITKDENNIYSGIANFIAESNEGVKLEFNNVEFNNIQLQKNGLHYIPLIPTENLLILYLATTYQKTDNFIRNSFLLDFYYTNQNKAKNNYWKIIEEHTQTSNDKIIKAYWKESYAIIALTDYLLKNCRRSIKNEAKLNTYLSELYAFRSYVYFQLITWFGDVPYIPLDYSYESNNLTRISVTEIIEKIIEDTSFASENLSLPSSNDASNRINKIFVKTLLTRLYLFNKDYQKSIEIGESVIDENYYSLASSLDILEKDNSELIFGFKKIFSSTHLNTNYLFNNTYNLPYVTVMRYSEILLNLAYCNNAIGNTSEAIKYINILRERKGMELITSSLELTNIIRQQWFSELKFEGTRFNTLKQFSLANQVLNLTNFQLLLPIPQEEINLNSNIIQNPGY